MKKEKGANFLKPALANILGAIICYAIVLILLFFRLSDIWPFFPIILVLTLLFLAIHSHYQKVAQQLRLYEGIEKRTYDGNLVLVLVGNVTRVSVGAINYAQSIGDEVLAMHISTKETVEKDRNSPRICRLLPNHYSEKHQDQLSRHHHPYCQVCQTDFRGSSEKELYSHCPRPPVYP